MKKKLLSAVLSMACVLGGASVFADETPRVFVDGCEVVFRDQAPVIEEDRTLIPVRGVMEAAGAKVRFFQETQKVQIESYDYWRTVELIIGKNTIKSSKLSDNLMTSETVEYELEVPAKVVNDRTLIPLRAVNDAFQYKTDWDEEARIASVTTDRKQPEVDKDTTVYLSTEAEDVSEGDTFDVYVNIKNFADEEEKIVNGATIGLIYDKTKFKLAGSELYNIDKPAEGVISATNENLSDDSIKVVSVTINEESCLNTDGAFYKFTFNALSDDGGTISLSKRYNSKIGYDTTVLVTKDSKGDDLTPMEVAVNETAIELK